MSRDVDNLLRFSKENLERFVDDGNHSGQNVIDLWFEAKAEKERADKAEKHRDTLKEAYRMMYRYVPETARKEYGFEEFYNALYSKEEEAKP